jgi:hypothetical protein
MDKTLDETAGAHNMNKILKGGEKVVAWYTLLTQQTTKETIHEVPPGKLLSDF